MATWHSPYTGYRQLADVAGNWISLLDGSEIPFTPPTPPSASCHVGAYPGEEGSETRPEALARLQSQVGATLQAIRCYDAGEWIPEVETVAGLYGMAAGSSTAVFLPSIEPNASHTATDIGNGVYNSDLDAYAAWCSDNRNGLDCYPIFAHELDGKIVHDTYTLAQIAGAFATFCSRFSLHGDAGLFPTLVFTGTSFAGSTGRWRSYWPTILAALEAADTTIGAFGCDQYQNSTVAGITLQSKWNPILDEITSGPYPLPSSVRLVIPETGWSTNEGTSPDPLAYVTSCGWAKTSGLFHAISWFDSSNTADNHLADEAGCAAEWGDIINS